MNSTARNMMSGRDLFKYLGLLAAPASCIRASGKETAARLGVDGRGQFTLQRDGAQRLLYVKRRYGR
jgi:hypothetical protein